MKHSFIIKYCLLAVAAFAFVALTTTAMLQVSSYSVANSAESEPQNRQTRQTNGSSNTQTSDNKTSTYSNFYSEEQRPVVVHVASEPAFAVRQSAFGPPVTGDRSAYQNDDDNPYYADDSSQQQPYESEEEAAAARYNDYAADDADNEEGRSAQKEYDSYYRQWQYATPPPSRSSSLAQNWDSSNRKLQAQPQKE